MMDYGLCQTMVYVRLWSMTDYGLWSMTDYGLPEYGLETLLVCTSAPGGLGCRGLCGGIGRATWFDIGCIGMLRHRFTASLLVQGCDMYDILVLYGFPHKP